MSSKTRKKTRKKARKKARKKVIPHPKHLLIPFKNIYAVAKVGGELFIVPLVEVVAEVGKTLGKDVIGDILVNSQLLVKDLIWGTDTLKKKMRKHTARKRRRKRKRRRSTRKKRR